GATGGHVLPDGRVGGPVHGRVERQVPEDDRTDLVVEVGHGDRAVEHVLGDLVGRDDAQERARAEELHRLREGEEVRLAPVVPDQVRARREIDDAETGRLGGVDRDLDGLSIVRDAVTDCAIRLDVVDLASPVLEGKPRRARDLELLAGNRRIRADGDGVAVVLKLDRRPVQYPGAHVSLPSGAAEARRSNVTLFQFSGHRWMAADLVQRWRPGTQAAVRPPMVSWRMRSARDVTAEASRPQRRW